MWGAIADRHKRTRLRRTVELDGAGADIKDSSPGPSMLISVRVEKVVDGRRRITTLCETWGGDRGGVVLRERSVLRQH